MRRSQQPTPSPSSSDSDGSDIESCFDTGDEQKKTDVDTDVDGDDKADLLNLEWLARKEDHTSTMPMDVDTDVDKDSKANLA